jgi:tRNA(Ile)-lysidine synthase
MGREAQRALSRRLLRRALGAVRGDLRRVTQTHVESVLRLAESGQSGQRLALPGVEVERVFDRLVFRPPAASETERPGYTIKVEAPGTVELPGGRILSLKLVEVAELQSGYNNSKGAADAARVRFPLWVRTWRPGDSFRPAGALRPKKLKALFQQRRVPIGERRRTPVVLAGDEIAWAGHLGVAAGYELTSDSRTALLITERGEE